VPCPYVPRPAARRKRRATGGPVRAEVAVVAIDPSRRRVTLETRGTVGDTTVLKGEALVPAPNLKFD